MQITLMILLLLTEMVIQWMWKEKILTYATAVNGRFRTKMVILKKSSTDAIFVILMLVKDAMITWRILNHTRLALRVPMARKSEMTMISRRLEVPNFICLADYVPI